MSFQKYVYYIDKELLPPLPSDKQLIIDLETTGLDPEIDIIICGGFFDCKKRKIIIYFLPDPDDSEKFRRFLRNTILWYRLKKYTIWSYNSEFEEKFLGIRNTIQDLMVYRITFKTHRESDDDYYEIPSLVRTKMISASNYIIQNILKDNELKKQIDELDTSYISSSLIPNLYLKRWLLRKDKEAIEYIIKHNYADLIREYCILWYYYYTLEKLRNHILKEYLIFPKIIIKNLKLQVHYYLL